VTTRSGKEFQIQGAAAGKARLPTVDSDNQAIGDSRLQSPATANMSLDNTVHECKNLTVDRDISYNA